MKATALEIRVQVGRAVHAAREQQVWSKERAAGELGWPRSKVHKVETGAQEISLTDLVDLARLFGPRVLQPLIGLKSAGHEKPAQPASGPLFYAQRLDDPDEVASMHIVRVLHAELNNEPAPSLEGGFFPLGAAFRVVPGAKVPARFLSTTERGARRKLPEAEAWLTSVLKRSNVGTAKLAGLTTVPVIDASILHPLLKPEPARWGPVAPSLMTWIRGKYMVADIPRIVVDGASMTATVITEPALVLHPLKMLVLEAPSLNPEDGLDDLKSTTSALVFRAAALISSSWGRQWAQNNTHWWFGGDEGPFRDLPLPSRLWHEEDGEAQQLEATARKIWAGTGAEAGLWKRMNAQAEGLVAALRPGRTR